MHAGPLHLDSSWKDARKLTALCKPRCFSSSVESFGWIGYKLKRMVADVRSMMSIFWRFARGWLEVRKIHPMFVRGPCRGVESMVELRSNPRKDMIASKLTESPQLESLTGRVWA